MTNSFSIKNFFQGGGNIAQPSSDTVLNGNIAFNEAAIKQRDKSTLLSVAKAFGSGWIFFSGLSMVASWYTFNKIGLQAGFEVDENIILVISGGLSLMLEVFKHYGLKWIFTSQKHITRALSLIITPVLFVVSFELHIKGADMMGAIKKTNDINSELTYLKELKSQDIKIKENLSLAIVESSKALNNGSSHDDEIASKSIKTNQDSMKLQIIEASPQMMSLINRKLDAKKDERASSQDAMVILLIMADAFILFSLLSYLIIDRNSDEELLNYQSLEDELKGMIGGFWSAKKKDLVTNTLNGIDYYSKQTEQKNNVPNYYSNTAVQQGYNSVGSYNLLPNASKLGVMPTNTTNGVTGLSVSSINKNSVPSLTKEEIDRIENRKLYVKEIIQIKDAGGSQWLYFRGFIANISGYHTINDETGKKNKSTLSMYIERPLPSGFDADDISVQYRDIAITVGYPIDTDSQRGMWAEAIVSYKKTMPTLPARDEDVYVDDNVNNDNDDIKDAESTIIDTNRVIKTIDADSFDSLTSEIIKLLWDGGNVKKGSILIGRRKIESYLDKDTKKRDIDDVYDMLQEEGYIYKSKNGRSSILVFKANVDLYSRDYKEEL